MIVSGWKCNNCKDILFSRAGHDFRYCSCGEVFVDGGQSEHGGRLGFGKSGKPTHVHIEVVDAASSELYQDWNFRKETMGLIQRGTIDLRQRIILRSDALLGSKK